MYSFSRLPTRVGTLAVALLLWVGPADAQLAAGHSKFLGAVGGGTSSPRADATFDTYWDQITPENAGKWRYPERDRDQMDWATLDYWYDYAQQRGIPFKQHTFVWGMQQPDWIAGLPPAEQRAEVEEWIRLYFQRYPETDMVDVLNEPITIPAGYRGGLGGAGATGWDWVIWTFETAKRYRDQYAPGAQLILNEHSILKNAGKMNQYLEIVDLLIDRGLLDGIGLQGHFLESTPVSTVQSHLNEVASRGLPIYISEFDLNIGNDQAQLAKYQELFPVLWEHPSVAGITLWGYKQGEIWRSGAYLVRSDGSERPALSWLRDYLEVGPGDGRDAYARIEAESHDAQQGVQTWSSAFGYFDAGDWVRYDDVDFGVGAASVTLDLALPASFAGKRIELRLDSPSGPLVGTHTTVGTGGWNAFATQSTLIDGASAVHDLYLVGASGTAIANVDGFVFEAAGGTSVVVRARGRRGEERMELRVAGQAVRAWTVTTAFEDYVVDLEGDVAASDVSVAFTNDDSVSDGTGRDLRVDRVTVAGTVYESESPATFSTGTWSQGSGCADGYKTSEWLHCPGAFLYDQASSIAPVTASAQPEAAEPSLSVVPNPAHARAAAVVVLE
ncbi:endo-1,4-beta-xylanase, partial [Rubrivirga sp.]|uniref:endo-1,4-beta-xylanase n=1 Tax=Rubrivirga sp. TaxID=1885344 RepID=UPI003C77BD1D